MSDQGAGTTGDDADGDRRGSGPWPWVAGGLLLVVLVLVGVLLLGDRGSDESDAAASSTSSSSTSSTSSTTSSTTTSSSTTSTTAAATTTTSGTTSVTADPAQCADAGSDPANPEPAAQAVFIAWTRGDTACADELMTDDALDELFARDGTDATDEFQGCFEADEPDPHTDCAFTYPGGSTHYSMNFSPTDGWQIYEVYQVAD